MDPVPRDVEQLIFRWFTFQELYWWAQCTLCTEVRKELRTSIEILKKWAMTFVNRTSEHSSVDLSTPLQFSTTCQILKWSCISIPVPSGLVLFQNLRVLVLKNGTNQHNALILPPKFLFSDSLERLEMEDVDVDLMNGDGHLPKLSKLIIINNRSLRKIPEWIARSSRLQSIIMIGCPYLENIPTALLQRVSRSEKCTTWDSRFQEALRTMRTSLECVVREMRVNALKRVMVMDMEEDYNCWCICVDECNDSTENELRNTISTSYPSLTYQQVVGIPPSMYFENWDFLQQ